MTILLSERQRDILRLVVEEYVATGQPVGSKTLVERAALGVSPSTVRYELAELERQADSMETYFECVVETLTAAGYRWYETANFCRGSDRAGGRDLRARHNLGYWLGRDYLGIGVGAVSTIDQLRWRNAPSLHRYVAAVERGERPAREPEELSPEVRDAERVMLGLRLDEPLPLAGLAERLDAAELQRLTAGGLVQQDRGSLSLTRRGRFVGGGVTARLLA